MVRKSLATIFLVVLTLIAADVGLSADTTKVACSEAVRGYFFVPLYVAHGLKLFEKQGLQVEIISAQGGPMAMQALASGQVQFCATGHGQVANMYAKGKSSKIVNVMQDKCTFYMIGRPEFKDIKSLKGKMIGSTKIGAETYAVGRFLAANAGLDPTKDITMVSVGGMASMASAIDKNRVQATMAWQPLTTKLIKENKVALLARLNTKKDSLKHFGSPYYSFSVIQVTDDYIKKHPDIVQKFVNAMVESEKWIAAHSSDEIAKIVGPYFPGMKTDVVKSSIDQDREAFCRNGISTKQGHDTAIKVFMDAKILKKPVPFEAIVDNSFSEKAN